VDQQRVAVVTGGAKGIGAAIAARLSSDGLAVAVLDVDVDSAEATAAGLGGSAHQADVSSYDSVRSAVDQVLERWDRIDVLVNNAGWDRVQPFLDNEPELWDRLIGVNLLGPINLCHVVLPHMVSQGSGRAVNVASDAGRVGAEPAAAVFVGDRLYDDVGGAQTAGMRAIQTVQFRREEEPEPRPDAVIEHLSDLPEVLRRWEGPPAARRGGAARTAP